METKTSSYKILEKPGGFKGEQLDDETAVTPENAQLQISSTGQLEQT